MGYTKKSGKAPGLKRADSFEYWKDKMTPYGARTHNGREQQHSEPDRCFFVPVNSQNNSSNMPVITFKLAQREERPTKLGVEWETSRKAKEEELGFLDLPREVRDLIYQEIAGELKREGVKWKATTPAQRTDEVVKSLPNKKGPNTYGQAPVVRPDVFADCAIMRTCHQLHSEFASTLYSSPLQLHCSSGQLYCSNTIPISPLYAGLVRSMFFVYGTLDDASNNKSWRDKLQMATSISKLFPQATCLRLAWFISEAPKDPVNLVAGDPEAWDKTVQEAEKTIKTVTKISKTVSNVALIMPHNLEVLQVRSAPDDMINWPYRYNRVKSLASPLTEAVQNLRAKPPQRKGVQTKKTAMAC
ncbi:hypothetical protein FB567DRAFT_333398 [Paraphoma chrysanthemicola]|uniref:Uncharacterized protein n=1 Tax=Paraphoma chrysanthemicola TaxID=798071 RepID=A0A8K0R822_9PLEO|nr:hypothetical protein FB567DRAFT_333398 [Paraphoma chrysanthemicola]